MKRENQIQRADRQLATLRGHGVSIELLERPG